MKQSEGERTQRKPKYMEQVWKKDMKQYEAERSSHFCGKMSNQ